jgi:hypothetical protein
MSLVERNRGQSTLTVTSAARSVEQLTNIKASNQNHILCKVRILKTSSKNRTADFDHNDAVRRDWSRELAGGVGQILLSPEVADFLRSRNLQ